jgi:superfamily I DNA/RNA helicase
MAWLIPPSELTPDQQRAIQLSPTENRAIVGGPGSGKTQVLLYRARHLAESLRVSSERFRIFVYTNVLKDYIKAALHDLRLPEEAVVTFDHWCRLYFEQHISKRLPWNAEAKTPDFAAVRKAVMARACQGSPLFDFVLVDEAQDLDEEVFAFLARASRHVTVCLDHKQQIYDHG